MKVSQCLKILRIMLEHKEKKVWKASDFQSGEFFVGYEATARMSDLMRIYPDQFIVGKDGRFRTLELNWENINEDFKKQVL
jgi:hypothetical protein